jgi:hypothetical protein
LLDVPTLRVAELELLDEPSGLGGVVVLDRRLEVLALRRRLAELPTQPPQQTHLGGFHASSVPRRKRVRPTRRSRQPAQKPGAAGGRLSRGKRLLFIRAPKPAPGATITSNSLWTVGSGGSGVKRLFALENQFVRDPEISHDGRRIAFDDGKGTCG